MCEDTCREFTKICAKCARTRVGSVISYVIRLHVTAQIKLPDLPEHTISSQFIEMATGGGAAAHGVSVLLTEKFCEFLHSPCWLYPVIKFFSDCIDGKFEVTPYYSFKFVVV